VAPGRRIEKGEKGARQGITFTRQGITFIIDKAEKVTDKKSITILRAPVMEPASLT
jgi:hypothetical protein